MTEFEKDEIKQLHINGDTYREIVDKTGYCYSYIYMICSGQYERLKKQRRKKYAERKAAAK